MRLREYSIRRRLLWSLLLSMLVVLGSLGYLSKSVTQEETEEIFSARLATSARVLEALLARQLEKATLANPIVIELPEEIGGAAGDAPNPAGHPYENKIAFQVWRGDGVMLARSSSAPSEPLGPLVSGFHEHHADSVLWKVFALRSGGVWVLAAEKDEVQQEMIQEITLSIISPLLLGGIALLVVVNLVALRAVKPVEALAKSISDREPSSLRPIRLPNTPVELLPVINELNALLGRVGDAFSREQRLIDSAAHELRTPISAVHLHIQNALNAPQEQERNASLQQALGASRRAAKLAEQLLVYSRVSASAGMEDKSAVALDVVCRDMIEVLRPVLESHQQQVDIQVAGLPVVYAEATKLERLARNLIENAAQHGVKPGLIVLSIVQAEGKVVLTVSNDGPAIPEPEKSRIFIPYYRIVGTSTFGSGLGLSIVQEIVTQLSGSVRVEDISPGRGARFVVTLPAAG